MAAHYFKKNKLLKTLNQHDPIQSPIASMPASRDDMVDACQNVPDNFFKNIDSDSCQCIPIINDDECQQFLLDGTFGKGVSDCNCFSETGAKIVPIYMPPNTSPNPLSNIQHIMDQINKGVPVPLQTNDNSDNLQLMSHFLLLMGDMKTYDSDGNLT